MPALDTFKPHPFGTLGVYLSILFLIGFGDAPWSSSVSCMTQPAPPAVPKMPLFLFFWGCLFGCPPHLSPQRSAPRLPLQAIGMTVFVGAIAIGGVSGAALNPAVGTALPIVCGKGKFVWVSGGVFSTQHAQNTHF